MSMYNSIIYGNFQGFSLHNLCIVCVGVIWWFLSRFGRSFPTCFGSPQVSVLNLMRLFRGWGFPLHRPYIGEYLNCRHLKLLMKLVWLVWLPRLNSPSNAVSKLEIPQDFKMADDALMRMFWNRQTHAQKNRFHSALLFWECFFSCSDLPSVLLSLFALGPSSGQNFAKFVQHFKDLIRRFVQALSKVKGKQTAITRGYD